MCSYESDLAVNLCSGKAERSAKDTRACAMGLNSLRLTRIWTGGVGSKRFLLLRAELCGQGLKGEEKGQILSFNCTPTGMLGQQTRGSWLGPQGLLDSVSVRINRDADTT